MVEEIKIQDNFVPPATRDTLGGIIVGENLSITEDGILSSLGGSQSTSGLNLFDVIIRNSLIDTSTNFSVGLSGEKIEFSKFPSAVNRIKLDWQSTSSLNYAYLGPTGNAVKCTVANGKACGFFNRGYYSVPEQRLGEANTWSIECIFSYEYSAQQGVFGMSAGQDYKQVVIQLDRNKTQLYLSSTGSGWNIANGTAGITALVIGKLYKVKLEFTGTQYIVYITDLETGVTTTETTVNNSNKVFVSGTAHAFGNNIYGSSSQNHLYGYIDITSIKIYKNNNLSFEGAKYIPYKISTSGRKIVDVQYKDLVEEYYRLNGNADFYSFDVVNNDYFYLPKQGKGDIILQHRAEGTFQPANNSMYYTIWDNGFCEVGATNWYLTDNWTICFPFNWADTLYSINGGHIVTDAHANLGVNTQYVDKVVGNFDGSYGGYVNWCASGFIDLNSLKISIPTKYVYYFLANSEQPISLRNYEQELDEYTNKCKADIRSINVVPIAMRPYVPYPVTDFTLLTGELNCDGTELSVWNDIKIKFDEYTTSGGISGGNPKGIPWVDFSTYDSIKQSTGNTGCAFWGYDEQNNLLRTPCIMDGTVVSGAITKNGYFQTLRDQMPSMIARAGYVASNNSFRQQTINAMESWTATQYQSSTCAANSDTLGRGINVVKNDTNEVRNKQVCYPWRVNISNIYVPATEVQWTDFVNSLQGKANVSQIQELSKSRVWVSDWTSYTTGGG